jgi:hypothetical protein
VVPDENTTQQLMNGYRKYYIPTMEYYLAINKNEVSICRQMDETERSLCRVK